MVARVCAICQSFPCRCPLVSLLEKQCVCGGVIRAESGSREAIFFAVGSHNRTAIHEEWRRWTGR